MNDVQISIRLLISWNRYGLKIEVIDDFWLIIAVVDKNREFTD